MNDRNPALRLSWLIVGIAILFFALSAFSRPAFFFGLALAAIQVQAALLPRSLGQNCRLLRWTLYGVGLLLAALWLHYSGGAAAGIYPEAMFLVPLMALFGGQRIESLVLILIAIILGGAFLFFQRDGSALYSSIAELGGWTAVNLAAWFLFGVLWEDTRLAAEREETLQLLREEYMKTLARLAQAEELAITDHLTQLYNHRYFEQRLEKMLHEFHSLSTLTVLMIDIDYFKEINDKYGHLVGNQVLIEVGDLLRHEVREKDVVARYGGEEFALLLPGVDCKRAKQVAERIRRAVEEHIFARDKGLELHLTVSIGIATWPQDARDRTELLSRADAALYRAKSTGRNTVCAYQLLERNPLRESIKFRTLN